MIKKDTIPVAPWKGLFLDGVNVPGGCSKAENVIFLQDGTAERRAYERTLAESPGCLASRSLKSIYELLKANGTRYLFADVDNSDAAIASFGSELVTHFATWTAVSGWAYPVGTGPWNHTVGSTSLVAVGEPAVVATTQYRIVASVTCAAPSSAGTNWAYTSTDSTYTWTSTGGGTNIIWSNKWTHSAGAATALTAISDFTPVAGQSYRLSVYVTHTSGTGVEVFVGGKSGGVISSTGQHELLFTFVTDATALRFVPSSDWVGIIEATLPGGAMAYSRPLSVKKFIAPDGPNIASNWGDEMLGIWETNSRWYPEAAASINNQQLSVYIGGVLGGAIQDSGTYTYDVTATATTALTFTPSAAWAGSINSVSVKAMTLGSTGTKTKVIGGTVTGTNDYETSWANILTDLTAGDAIKPQWATLQDRAFRVDGTNQNYWFDDVSGYHTLGVPSPDVAPITASTTGGELLAGAYNIYYTYVKKDNEYVVEGNPSTASNITIAGTAITVSVVALADPDVTHIRIYRTLYSEIGSDAYLAMEVNNATGTHTLVLSDDVIGDGEVLVYNNDRPPLGKYVLGAGSRLWLIDTAGLLHWSRLDYPEQMPGLNQQSFDPKDGDVVMGMCALRSNLLVFKRRRTWLMNMFSQSTDDEGNASLSKDIISSTLGCIATGSIQSAGQESAIWLSAAGFILYDGGTFRNISGGDIQTGTPSRIQSVINDFMENGAENFIDSAYHSTKQLYHVLFLYRNNAGTEITSQRHFVYNLITDTWTEYVYRSDAGVKYYETNFALAHDGLGNEVVLIPYLADNDGTVTYIYQSDYTGTPGGNQIEILDSAGDGVTALDSPLFTFSDNSGNVYVFESGYYGFTHIFKITAAGAKSLLIEQSDIETAAYLHPGGTSIDTNSVAVDLTNSCFYIAGIGINVAETYFEEFIVKITFTGACTLIVKNQTAENVSPVEYAYSMSNGRLLLNSTGTILYYRVNYNHSYDTPVLYSGHHTPIWHKVTDLGSSNIDTVIYTADPPRTHSDYSGTTLGDKLYILGWTWDYWGGTVHHTISTYSPTEGFLEDAIDINFIYGETLVGMIVVSATEIYLRTTTNVYKMTYSGSTWSHSLVLALTDGSGSLNTFLRRSNGDFILGYGDSNKAAFNIYDSNFNLKVSETVTGATTTADGMAYMRGTADDEEAIIVCGETSRNVWRVFPGGYWEIIVDNGIAGGVEPDMYGAVVDIVSNYTNLGIANDKRIKRVYLPIESQYATIGAFTLEPDYGINRYVHVSDETTEPAGATSLLPFGHPGSQSWKYTNDQFDGAVENWQNCRIDVGTQGSAFRYSIKIGDVKNANHGVLRIRPPMVEVQIKGKY